MQVLVRIGDRKLFTLIDPGSTHNFINEDIVATVGSNFSSGRRPRVTVANGDHVTCRGLLRHAAIVIDPEHFVADLHATQ